MISVNGIILVLLILQSIVLIWWLWRGMQNSIQNGMSKTHQQMLDIMQQSNQQLHLQTNAFSDVTKRLALIDEAQKKITELSGHMINLHTILSNKQARGSFGEIQLATLICDVLPESKFAFQYTLSNGRRADCILFLPPPTGNIIIDAKFPLENYQHMLKPDINPAERQSYENRFRSDIIKHIRDIAEKYIIPNETADGAIMFIPAEGVFAEIHNRFPELVELSYQHRVWLTSPTTLMAILNTARAVLKDEATREEIHLIQQHLSLLAKDFSRFQIRVDNLSKHIQQAHTDVSDIQITANKIVQRFQKIEKVELKIANESRRDETCLM